MKSTTNQTIDHSRQKDRKAPSKKNVAQKRRKKKKSPKPKESVRLREKELRNGNISLYLEIYWNGQREYDFLRLYLIDPQTPEDREQNQATYNLAHTIKAQRLLDLQSGRYKIKNPLKGASFIEYIKKIIKERINSRANLDNWDAALNHVLGFTKNKDVTFEEVDATWLIEFRHYLMNSKLKRGEEKLKPNTAYTYFNKVKAALEDAFEEGIINEQTGKRVKSPKPGETKIVFLEWSEVERLAKTPCDSVQLKTAFLFSVLSGLRWSDVVSITWLQIRGNASDGWFIDFSQKKTNGFTLLPISNQARALLGEQGASDEKIFKGLKYSAWNNMRLTRWMLSAGIYRHITFHVARHTYATQLLAHGVDIYVVSKMLGHKTVKTTEVYAKVVLELKVKAARSLPSIEFLTSEFPNIQNAPPMNTEAEIRMLIDWLNVNRISASTLVKVLSKTKEMVGTHTQHAMAQNMAAEGELVQGQVLTAVNFVTSLSFLGREVDS